MTTEPAPNAPPVACNHSRRVQWSSSPPRMIQRFLALETLRPSPASARETGNRPCRLHLRGNRSWRSILMATPGHAETASGSSPADRALSRFSDGLHQLSASLEMTVRRGLERPGPTTTKHAKFRPDPLPRDVSESSLNAWSTRRRTRLRRLRDHSQREGYRRPRVGGSCVPKRSSHPVGTHRFGSGHPESDSTSGSHAVPWFDAEMLRRGGFNSVDTPTILGTGAGWVQGTVEGVRTKAAALGLPGPAPSDSVARGVCALPRVRQSMALVRPRPRYRQSSRKTSGGPVPKRLRLQCVRYGFRHKRKCDEQTSKLDRPSARRTRASFAAGPNRASRTSACAR